jgi:hypothetical protein
MGGKCENSRKNIFKKTNSKTLKLQIERKKGYSNFKHINNSNIKFI